jgi:hypothetical protein
MSKMSRRGMVMEGCGGLRMWWVVYVIWDGRLESYW